MNEKLKWRQGNENKQQLPCIIMKVCLLDGTKIDVALQKESNESGKTRVRAEKCSKKGTGILQNRLSRLSTVQG
eukprot:1137778-Pelagomonas_calceolata.AAC.5